MKVQYSREVISHLGEKQPSSQEVKGGPRLSTRRRPGACLQPLTLRQEGGEGKGMVYLAGQVEPLPAPTAQKSNRWKVRCPERTKPVPVGHQRGQQEGSGLAQPSRA